MISSFIIIRSIYLVKLICILASTSLVLFLEIWSLYGCGLLDSPVDDNAECHSKLTQLTRSYPQTEEGYLVRIIRIRADHIKSED